MSRIELICEDDDAAPQDAREVLNEIKVRRGSLINVYRALAHRPAFARAIADIYLTVVEDELITAAECELAYLSASVMNDCFYCVPTHIVLGRKAGLSAGRIEHIGDDPLPQGVYTPAEAAIVHYGQRSTRKVTVDADTYGALEEHFNSVQIMDIWAIVGLANMINRFHETFYTELEQSTLDSVQVADRRAAGESLRPPPVRP